MTAGRLRISRRSALGLGGAGLAALALGGWAVLGDQTLTVPPSAPLQALSPAQYSVLVAVADTVNPGGDGVPSALELDVAGKLDALLAKADPALAQELGLGLLLLENRALRLTQGAVSFTQASPAQRHSILWAWRTQGFALQRTVAKALVGLCSATYWASEETWRVVGYPGPGAHLEAG